MRCPHPDCRLILHAHRDHRLPWNRLSPRQKEASLRVMTINLKKAIYSGNPLLHVINRRLVTAIRHLSKP